MTVDKKLKYYAKKLNQDAPEGEFLAYINKKESNLLKRKGGLGIKTRSGIPSYIGSDASGQGGGASGGGPGDASDSDSGGGKGGGGGGSTNREKGIMSRGLGPKGTTADIGGFEDKGPDRSAVSPFSTYGINRFNQSLQSLQPNVFEKGLDLYKKYSPLGMTIRGITSLVDKFTGPRAVDYNDGYNMANISGPVSRDFGPEDSVGGDNIDSYVSTNQYPITGIIPEEGIATLLNSIPQDPFKSRYLQSQPKDIREAIEASMQNYYT